MQGSRLGPYELFEEIGRGGMAAVYRGQKVGTARKVAVKVIFRSIAADSKAIERFKREADLVMRLEHPHILPVYDFDGESEPPYIVMRYMPTGTLKDVMERARLPLPEVVQLFSQIASALDYAHRNGVIHRDIKPSNILVDADGNAFLTDFGIARIVEGDTNQGLTGTGMAVGTPGYMAPEQGMGTAIDGRADIYALGVMLFEMLTGQMPFQAQTPMAVILKHINEPAPLISKFQPELPPGLDSIILRAMAKKPEDRYPTATDMARALAGAVGPVSNAPPVRLREVASRTISELEIARAQMTPPPLPKTSAMNAPGTLILPNSSNAENTTSVPDSGHTSVSRSSASVTEKPTGPDRQLIVIASIAFTLIVIGLAGFLLINKNAADNAPAQTMAAQLETSTLQAAQAATAVGAITLAHTLAAPGTASALPPSLTATLEASPSPTAAPVTTVTASATVTLAESPTAISTDLVILAVRSATPLPTATPTLTHTLAPTSTPIIVTATPVPPTNTPFIITATPLPTSTATNTALPTATPTQTLLPPTGTPTPTWTVTPIPPSNTPVPPTNTALPPTSTQLSPTSTPVPPTVTPTSTSSPAMSMTAYSGGQSATHGKIAFIGRTVEGGAEQQIAVVDTGGDAQTIVKSNDGYSSLQWSPRKDEFGVLIRTASSQAIWIVSLDGSPTFFAAGIAFAWSSDGAWIAFIGSDPANKSKFELFVRESRGARQVQLTRDSGIQRSAAVLSWSPDGKRIAYLAPSGIKIADATATGVRPSTALISDSRVSALAWSPDGKSIAYVTGATGSNVALVDSVKGGVPQVLQGPTAVGNIVWSPTGGKLAYAATDTHIYVADLTNNTFLALARALQGCTDPAWSRDGLWLAFSLSGSGDVYEVALASPDNPIAVNVQKQTGIAGTAPVWEP